MDVNFFYRENQGIVIIDVHGKIVLGDEATSLRDEVKKLLAEQKNRIVLNMAAVSRVDSAGIGALVESVILTAQGGGRLKLLNVPRLLHNSLAIHRLLQAFEIYTSEADALASFSIAAPAAGATA